MSRLQALAYLGLYLRVHILGPTLKYNPRPGLAGGRLKPKLPNCVMCSPKFYLKHGKYPVENLFHRPPPVPLPLTPLLVVREGIHRLILSCNIILIKNVFTIESKSFYLFCTHFINTPINK